MSDGVCILSICVCAPNDPLFLSWRPHSQTSLGCQKPPPRCQLFAWSRATLSLRDESLLSFRMDDSNWHQTHGTRPTHYFPDFASVLPQLQAVHRVQYKRSQRGEPAGLLVEISSCPTPLSPCRLDVQEGAITMPFHFLYQSN